MNNTEFSSNAIAGFGIAGILGLIIPIAVLIIYKLKNKEAKLLPALIGAATFFVFVMVLESLLHQLVIPLVKDNLVLYTVYGALAAGVFEETGRFLAYKTVLKKHSHPSTSIMYGIGHGGFEALFICGVTMSSYFAMALMCNAMGFESFIGLMSGGNTQTAEALTEQFTMLTGQTVAAGLLAVYERIVAMTFHIAMSVLVFEAARIKGRIYLYPAAILLHAILDAPAALFQQGFVSLAVVYISMTIFVGITVVIAFFSFKRIKKQYENTAEQPN